MHRLLQNICGSHPPLPLQEFLDLNYPVQLIQEEKDPREYQDFINRLLIVTAVGNQQRPLPFPANASLDVRSTQAQVVDRVIQYLVSGYGDPSQQQHLLALGYRLTKRTAFHHGNLLENYFPNTMTNYVKSSNWELLLARVGEAIMEYLLIGTYLFEMLPNDCCLQITGIPVHRTVDITGFFSGGTRLKDLNGKHVEKTKLRVLKSPVKHSAKNPAPKTENMNLDVTTNGAENASQMDVDSSNTEEETVNPDISREVEIGTQEIRDRSLPVVNPKFSINFISRSLRDTGLLQYRIPRWNMFYNRTRHHIRRHYGFPMSHMLNEAKPDEDLRSLLRSIFPQENFVDITGNLENMSASKRRRLRKKANSVPKRLQPFQPILAQIVRRHASCPYRILIKNICPVGFIDECAIDGNSEPFQTQVLSVEQKEEAEGSQSDDESADADSLVNPLNYHSSYHSIFLLVRSVILRVFPNSVWGTKENFNMIMGNLEKFISMRRFETVMSNSLLLNIDITKIQWLATEGSKDGPVRPSDLEKRQKLLLQFLIWLYDHFVIPFLKYNFYVTESTPHKNRVFYYRHDLWQKITEPALGQFCSTIFAPLDEDDKRDLMADSKAGYANLRLIPKESGLRPIINLKKRFPLMNAHLRLPSINFILTNAFQILSFEKERRPEIMGGSVLGTNDIYSKLKTFKLLVNSVRLKEPKKKLYFAKVDIKSSFDTINQERLLEVLRELLSNDEYLVCKYTTIQPNHGRLKKNFSKHVLDGDEFPDFPELAMKLAQQLTNAVIMDQVIYNFESQDEIYELILAHVTSNLVRVGNGYFKQRVGIPQGSILSTILCSLFYGYLEKKAFSYLKIDEDGVMLRLIDDFLYISFSRNKVEEFVIRMIAGFPEYGCIVNRDKTVCNFDLTANQKPLNNIQPNDAPVDFPWCGLTINTNTVDVKSDISRNYGSYLSDALTVEYGSKPGEKLKEKLIFYLKPKCHAIFLDTQLSSPQTVRMNIYQNFLLCAMKFHLYVENLGLANKSDKFLKDVVDSTVHAGWGLIRSRLQTVVAREHDCQFSLHYNEIIWLGLSAFKRALIPKGHNYHALVHRLTAALKPLEAKIRVLDQLEAIHHGQPIAVMLKRIIY